MLNRLVTAITPSVSHHAPSALLVVGTFGSPVYILHLVPENGVIERFGHSNTPSTKPFHRKGFTEQTREQIGTITCYVGDGDTAGTFLSDVETRVRKLWNDFVGSNAGSGQVQAINIETTDLVQNFLQPAALDAMREREGRDRSMNATQAYPVYILRITRSRAGAILTEPSSFC